MQVSNLPIEIGNYPFIKGTEQDELLVVTANNFGIFMGREGQIKQKSTVNMANKPFISITVFKTYLIALFETFIQVFNLSDAKLLSEMTLNPN